MSGTRRACLRSSPKTGSEEHVHPGSAMNDWQPTATIEALQARARLYAMIRRFFSERGVLEVETPILSTAGNTDPNIESFRLHFSRAGEIQRWLRTSPEFALKRLVAAGIGSCYELGRVFRNGEMGRMHNPEFSMLEWYRVGWTHHQLMDECAELVKEALRLAGRSASVRETSFRHLYQEHLGLDPLTASEAELRAPLAVFDIRAERPVARRLARPVDDPPDPALVSRQSHPAGLRLSEEPGGARRGSDRATCPWPSVSNCTSARSNWPTATTNSTIRPSNANASIAT